MAQLTLFDACMILLLACLICALFRELHLMSQLTALKYALPSDLLAALTLALELLAAFWLVVARRHRLPAALLLLGMPAVWLAVAYLTLVPGQLPPLLIASISLLHFSVAIISITLFPCLFAVLILLAFRCLATGGPG